MLPQILQLKGLPQTRLTPILPQILQPTVLSHKLQPTVLPRTLRSPMLPQILQLLILSQISLPPMLPQTLLSPVLPQTSLPLVFLAPRPRIRLHPSIGRWGTRRSHGLADSSHPSNGRPMGVHACLSPPTLACRRLSTPVCPHLPSPVAVCPRLPSPVAPVLAC